MARISTARHRRWVAPCPSWGCAHAQNGMPARFEAPREVQPTGMQKFGTQMARISTAHHRRWVAPCPSRGCAHAQNGIPARFEAPREVQPTEYAPELQAGYPSSAAATKPPARHRRGSFHRDAASAAPRACHSVLPGSEAPAIRHPARGSSVRARGPRRGQRPKARTVRARSRRAYHSRVAA